MRERFTTLSTALLCMAIGLTVLPINAAMAQDDEDMFAAREKALRDRQARQLIDKAQDYVNAGEGERAVKMLNTVVEQFPNSDVRFDAFLALGKYFLAKHQQPKAIHYFGQIRQLEDREDKPTGKLLDTYLESLYLTGVSRYQTRAFASAFPVLRKITANYPNTVWANQAYYYIGMCHFAQGNWNKAIDALKLVGTFIDVDAPTVQFAEAGRRFYVKVQDADLPILHRLGQQVRVQLKAASGDKAVVICRPLSERSGVFIGSIATQVGKPVDESKLTPAKSDVLQIIGGDEVSVQYFDGNTQQGDKDVERSKTVKMVSTGAVEFTMGTFRSQALSAYLGQPLFIKATDVDQDVSSKADKVTVKVFSRYKPSQDQIEAEVGSLADLAFREEEQDKWRVRDEVTIELSELGEGNAVHSGAFGGQVELVRQIEESNIDKTDDKLVAIIGDQVMVTYVDELHIGGQTARDATDSVKVVGEIDARPRVSQNVVSDVVLRAKKNLVEATAFLELARIFASMGLADGARQKAAQGLERVDDIIRTRQSLPTGLKEEAFKIRWELHIAQEDYQQAIATCRLFNQLYPNSPFVDQALIGIGQIKYESKDYRQAINIFQQVLALKSSQAKAQAQYMIAQSMEKMAEARAAAAAKHSEAPATGPVISEAAIRAYRQCAQRFPDSEYAGTALAKIVDYYVQTKDYQRADDLLDQIFQDYPDGKFLDNMLLKWVLVAYRMGNVQKSYEKCSQLLFEYPSSPHADTAKKLLPKIEARLKAKINE